MSALLSIDKNSFSPGHHRTSLYLGNVYSGTFAVRHSSIDLGAARPVALLLLLLLLLDKFKSCLALLLGLLFRSTVRKRWRVAIAELHDILIEVGLLRELLVLDDLTEFKFNCFFLGPRRRAAELRIALASSHVLEARENERLRLIGTVDVPLVGPPFFDHLFSCKFI